MWTVSDGRGSERVGFDRLLQDLSGRRLKLVGPERRLRGAP